MAKNSDWGSGKEVQDIAERFLERFPEMFEGFNVGMIHFVMTQKKKSKVPLKLHTIGHPAEVFVGRPYIVESFELWWRDMNQKQKNQAVFGIMSLIPQGAFDDTSKYYGKKRQHEIKMTMMEFAAFGGVPNWFENPAACDPMERNASEIQGDIPVPEAIPSDGVSRQPVTHEGIANVIPEEEEAGVLVG